MKLKFLLHGSVLLVMLSAMSIRLNAQGFGEEDPIELPPVTIYAPPPPPPPPPPPSIPPPDPCQMNPCSCNPQSCGQPPPNPCETNPCACNPQACSSPPPPPPPPPPQTQYGDHHLNTAKLPKTGVNAQIAGYCVFQTIENIIAYFGGTTQSGPIALAYIQETGDINGITNGFNGSNAQLQTLVNNFLISTPCSNMQTAIDAGDPVMAYIAVAGQTAYHEVMVTGYNTNGTYVYFDPQSTAYVTAPAGTVFNTPIQVTGKK
jgi:hypothetical protein